MIKILIKHLILEICIDVFFDNIKNNFFPKQSFFVVRDSDIPQIMELFERGHKTVDVIRWYGRLINISPLDRDDRYEIMVTEIVQLYSKHIRGNWDSMLSNAQFEAMEAMQDIAATEGYTGGGEGQTILSPYMEP